MPFWAKLMFASAVGFGFAAGKINLDDKIRVAIDNQAVKLARINARAYMDEMENRTPLLAVKAANGD